MTINLEELTARRNDLAAKDLSGMTADERRQHADELARLGGLIAMAGRSAEKRSVFDRHHDAANKGGDTSVTPSGNHPPAE